MRLCWHKWEDWVDIPKGWNDYPPKEQYRRCENCKRLKVRKTRRFDD